MTTGLPYPEKGVYVLGVVTKVVPPDDAAAVGELRTRFDGQIMKIWAQDFICVDFCKLGKIADLQPATQRYLGQICQSTLQSICNVTKATNETMATSYRADLLRNATIRISPADFPEKHMIYNKNDQKILGQASQQANDSCRGGSIPAKD